MNKIEDSTNSFYFTFGTNPQFPHGINEYVKVEARTMHEAEQIYRSVYPDVHENCLNCAFVYTEDEFAQIKDVYYKGVSPIETLTVKDAVLTDRDKVIIDYELSGAGSVYGFMNDFLGGLDTEQSALFMEAMGIPKEDVTEEIEEDILVER